MFGTAEFTDQFREIGIVTTSNLSNYDCVSWFHLFRPFKISRGFDIFHWIYP